MLFTVFCRRDTWVIKPRKICFEINSSLTQNSFFVYHWFNSDISNIMIINYYHILHECCWRRLLLVTAWLCWPGKPQGNTTITWSGQGWVTNTVPDVARCTWYSRSTKQQCIISKHCLGRHEINYQEEWRCCEECWFRRNFLPHLAAYTSWQNIRNNRL